MPVQAQTPIDLELGGEGATSWDIGNIKPGDSGTKTVELRNVGSLDGVVTIWISDIEEVDGGGDGALLDDYVLLGLSCPRLNTNIALPATIGDLPQSAADMNYIKINQLYSGETLTLVWEWQFPETGEPQNDSQGDSFSFTINYLLEELPSGGWGGGGIPSYQQLTIDILGKITVANISSSGKLLDSCVATDPDNEYKLGFTQGTRITCPNGRIPSRIEMRLCEESPSPPEGMKMIGPAYTITGYLSDSMPCPLIFDRPVELALGYDQRWLAKNTASIMVAVYEPGHGWIALGPASSGVAEGNQLTVLIRHASIFAILAEVVPSTPSARFELSGLAINPTQTEAGEPVTISTIVQNTGELEGSYTLNLEIDGQVEQSREATLAAGESQQVSFTVIKSASGTYAVAINGLTGEFVVLAQAPSLAPVSPPWIDTYWWVVLLIAVTIASLVYFLAIRPRQQP